MNTEQPNQSAESRAKEQIARQILNHVSSPGNTVSENQLAEQLGMSRTPVRTAIRELIAEGLLERVQPKGYAVARLTGEDRKQVFQVRARLEGLAAEQTATRVTPQLRTQLESLQQEMAEIFQHWNREHFTECNNRFHTTIAEASGNPYIVRFLKQCYWRSQLYIYSYDAFFRDPSEPQQQSYDGPYGFTYYDHGSITEAILAGEPEAAREAMERHIWTSYESLNRRE
ncbi:MAG: GntR family transcriptional regulator [Synergistales bacterium]|nr:GntR family transcriptional regulator [Synergistales bacterium]